MARRNRAEVRDVLPDPIYGDKLVTKLVNQVTLGAISNAKEYFSSESLF